MKILSKHFFIGLVLFGFLTGPLLVLAREAELNDDSTSQNNNLGAAFLCTRIGTMKMELNSKFAVLEKNRLERRANILDNLKERRANRIENVQQRREEIKQRFEERLGEIDTPTLTDAQKAALAKFKTTVEDANKTRKAAVDAAQQTFKTATDKLVTQRQDAIKTAGATLNTATTAALAKAKTDCAAGVDPATVRAALIASIKAARNAFKIAVAGIEKIGQQIEELAKIRNEAVRAASKTFKDAVKAAQKELKKILASS